MGEVYINGRFVPSESAAVPVDDRGYQFAESVYEVIRAYEGRPFEMERHMRRLQRSAEAVDIPLGNALKELEENSLELLRRSGLKDAFIYMQISTGAVPRAHLRPSGLEPIVLAMATPATSMSAAALEDGIKAITVPDERWARCYVKTTMLLPNTAAKRRAVAEGAEDAIFVRDGFLTEATAGNVFAVFQGVLHTPPKSNYILHGVTREVILEIAAAEGMESVEGPVPAVSLYRADELILTGTGFEMVAVNNLDGRTIGEGRPGPVFRRLFEAYRKRALG